MMNGLSRTIFYSNFFTRVANKKIDSFYSLSLRKSLVVLLKTKQNKKTKKKEYYHIIYQ